MSSLREWERALNIYLPSSPSRSLTKVVHAPFPSFCSQILVVFWGGPAFVQIAIFVQIVIFVKSSERGGSDTLSPLSPAFVQFCFRRTFWPKIPLESTYLGLENTATIYTPGPRKYD